MQSIGSGKPFKYPLPETWIKHIADNDVKSSFIFSRIFLLLSSLKRTVYGFAKFCILLAQRINPGNPNCPYVVFLNLQQSNLPESNREKSYDIISWYNKSKIKKSDISKIWVQANVKKSYITPPFLIVSRTIFPRFNHLHSYLQFLFKGILAFMVAIFGILRGKWWYGFLFPEAVNLHYVHVLKREFLADDYFFHNSNWYYKPLWSYEAEKKGSTVSLYYYSTNMENFQYNNHKKKETYGLTIMTWNNFIVWDQQQEEYIKQFCPDAVYTHTSYVDFSGIGFNSQPNNGVKRLAVFDVTPTRPLKYLQLGFAIPPYYSEELNLAFFRDVIEIFNNDDWEIYWKKKRVVDKIFVSKAFYKKQLELVKDKINIVNPNVAARALVEISDAVISMPFTSTAILGKIKGIPSVYYDASSNIQPKKSHDISVLRNISELANWKKTSWDPVKIK